MNVELGERECKLIIATLRPQIKEFEKLAVKERQLFAQSQFQELADLSKGLIAKLNLAIMLPDSAAIQEGYEKHMANMKVERVIL